MIIPAMNGKAIKQGAIPAPSPDRKPIIIAIDFDGTLCEDKWPSIGPPKWGILRWILKKQKAGNKIVLWTCREGESLSEAVEWCAQWGLVFDAVNDNLPEEQEKWQSNPRKIGADVYIDDKALNPKNIPEWWLD